MRPQQSVLQCERSKTRDLSSVLCLEGRRARAVSARVSKTLFLRPSTAAALHTK
jgi:hypothetical protein